MPNHVRNIVKMQGIGSLPLYSPEPLGEATDGSAAEKRKEYFDFGKVIPIPEPLKMDSGAIEDVAMEAALTCIAGAIAEDSLFPPFIVEVQPGFPAQEPLEERVKRCGITVRDAEELGLKYLENIIKYGHSSWYCWCLENWGTKWNSYDLERIDEDTIAFSTAWTNPAPIIMELSAQYPDRMIEHWWADEDMGANTGHRCIQDGLDDTMTPLNGSPDALELYVKCWGMDESLRRDERGELYVVDLEDEGE